MRVLIIEDEIPAFEKLRTLITTALKEDLQYDWARSVVEATHFLNSTTDYALIFSDIELLDGDVFEVLDEGLVTAPIIFCTAYDDYLLKAFKSNGIAYILKPYALEDVSNAFDKYKTLFKDRADHPLSVQVINELKQSLRDTNTNYKSQFVIKTKKGIHILETASIAIIEAKGDFSKVTDCDGKTHLYSQSIGNIYASLNPRQFFRINRSQVVHLAYILKMDNHFKNRLLLTLKGVSNTVMTSSAITADFRAWLDR